MLCPICKIDRLSKVEDSSLDCPECGLRRRPSGKILICEETNFRIFNRNVGRLSSGTVVEIIKTNSGLKSLDAQLKIGELTYALRSKTGFVTALSRDRDDLILLIVENDWHIEDSKIADLVKSIRYNRAENSARDAGGCS